MATRQSRRIAVRESVETRTWYTTVEAAEIAKVSPVTVWNWVKNGAKVYLDGRPAKVKLAAQEISRSLRIDKEAFANFLALMNLPGGEVVPQLTPTQATRRASAVKKRVAQRLGIKE